MAADKLEVARTTRARGMVARPGDPGAGGGRLVARLAEQLVQLVRLVAKELDNQAKPCKTS